MCGLPGNRGRKEVTLQARPYQVEIADMARCSSVIVKLNTGLGKTFIAVMVMRYHLSETYVPVSTGGKRILFIAKTVHLVYQHAEFLRAQLPVKGDEIGIYHGQVTPTVWIDSWSSNIWDEQLESHRVLVGTAGVFRDALNHGKISLRNICLLIFDECHHADPETKSDFTDICQHLHRFPPGPWLPDYSRGPKVLGLSASLVNNVKPGELSGKIRGLEALMRAKVVTSTDSSIKSVMGLRQFHITKFERGGSNILPNELYRPFAQCLLRGIEMLDKLVSKIADVERIDFETLFDTNRQIKKEVFFSLVELSDLQPRRIKRLLTQCICIMEEFGVYCAVHACEEIQKGLQNLLLLSSPNRITNEECIRIIQTCLKTLSAAIETYRQIKQSNVARLKSPPVNDPSHISWGEAIEAHFPMTYKTVQLLHTILKFRQKAQGDGQKLSALVLVKERITAKSVADLITGVSQMAPMYAGLRASFCVSSNSTRTVASMSTVEQLRTLEDFRLEKFNVMVATNVVEEGMDVHACNLVIKADSLTNFRSFIQSQGRARAAVSHFVILTDDAEKCRSNVRNFMQIEQAIDNALEDRCVESLRDEEDATDVSALRFSDVSYMPYGVEGPRITSNSAASVLMRYIAVMKTDSTYPLKILYSVEKTFGGYRFRLLMPPPSPLQEIITGPFASSKELAKQLCRLTACKRLHEKGLLNSDLLPIDLRKLIELGKRTRMSDEKERQAQMESLISGLDRFSLNSAAAASTVESRLPGVATQKHHLLTSFDDDAFTKKVLLDGLFTDEGASRGTVEGGGVECRQDANLEVDDEDEDEELPFGIVACGVAPRSECSPTCDFSAASKVQGTVVSPEATPDARLERHEKSPSDLWFGSNGRDDEKTVKTNAQVKKSKNAGYYEVHRLRVLSAPYQQGIEANRPVCLYTWRLPSPEQVARLTKVDPDCFRYTDQTIGLLFSKPICQSDMVCRVPLYMQMGMMRVRLRLTRTMTLTEEQLDLAHRAHCVLAQLSVDINKLTNFDLKFEWDQVSFFSAASSDSGTSRASGGSGSNCAIDPFSQLKVDPGNAEICSLLVIVRLPDGRFDEEASRALVQWGEEKVRCIKGGGNVMWAPSAKEQVPVQSGICPRYGVQLARVPMEEWRGLLVRPIDLPAEDPASFAVWGPNANGLRASSPISECMAKRLPQELREQGIISFLNYTEHKHGTLVRLVKETRGVDASARLATVTRISRHRNAANVMSGVGCVWTGVEQEDRLPHLCFVHPLNTWLWLILSLTPTVLHEVCRCLSIEELAGRLREVLVVHPSTLFQHLPPPSPWDLPAGEFLMPDRHSASPMCTPAMRKNLVRGEGASWHFERPGVVFSLESEACLDAEVEAKHSPPAVLQVPPLNSLYEAFTAVSANEAVNLERLETLGDSFLKFVATLRVFATSPPSMDEGQLTQARVRFISNSSLYKTSVKFDLFRYLSSTDFKPELRYVPPCYTLADPVGAFQRLDARTYVKMYDKAIADSVEAFLGVCLLNITAPRVARLLYLLGISEYAIAGDETVAGEDGFLSWVPLLLNPEHRSIDPGLASVNSTAMSKRRAEVEKMIQVNVKQCPSEGMAAQPMSRDLCDVVETKRLELQPLEHIIGYKFKRIETLLQAVTHPSSHYARVWGCYQRLEFLGDAVLDFVVTRRIYEAHSSMDPGELTDLRAALVSNVNLAIVSVRTGIFKFLEHMDPNLWAFINNFTSVVSRGVSNIWKCEYDVNERKEALSYKVLGDMLEAIIGAIFVDSGGSTPVVTSVISHLLTREFEAYGKELPLDPVRIMHELYPNLEIKVVDKSASDSDDSPNSSETSRRAGPDEQRQRPVRVEAKFEGCLLSGEGFNLRTAKLKVAEQLGIGFD